MGVQCHLDWARGVFPRCFGEQRACWCLSFLSSCGNGEKSSQSRTMGSCPWLDNLCMIISEVLVSQIWQNFVGMASAEWFRQKMQPCITYCQCPHPSQMVLLGDKILGMLVKPSSATVMEREERAQAPSCCLHEHLLPIYIWIWLKNTVGFTTAPLCRSPKFSLWPGFSLLLLSLPPHGLVNVFRAYASVSERTIWLVGTLNLLMRNPKWVWDITFPSYEMHGTAKAFVPAGRRPGIPTLPCTNLH